MRIVAGEYKGRRLESPDNYQIRPTSEIVKEALFSMLMNEIDGAVFVDAFAGTGSIGLEALSRGAVRSYFLENDREGLRILKANISKCGAQDIGIVVAGDALSERGSIREKVDIVFADPPYRAGYNEKILQWLIDRDILKKSGVFILEHDARIDVPQAMGDLKVFKERKYGKKKLSLYKFDEGAAND